jgi:ribonuclease J
MEMTFITFYGGVNEIGGTIILLEDKDTSVFFEQGKSFHKFNEFYNGFVTPRSFKEYLRLGLIPQMYENYREDLLESMDIKPRDKPPVKATFISHSHLDHCAYVSFLNRSIPIHCAGSTYNTIRVFEDVSERTLDTEITSYTERSDIEIKTPVGNFNVDKKGNITKIIGKYYIDNEGKIRKVNLLKNPDEPGTHEGMIIYNRIKPMISRTFVTRNRSGVDEIDVEFIPVDHSIFDAHAQIIYASDSIIAYTGDIRFHGPDSKRSLEFVDRVREAKPDVLIVDGTRVHEEETFTEFEVKAKIKKVLSEAKGLVAIMFSYRDLYRFISIKTAAEEMGRTFVTSPKIALYYVHENMRKILKNNFEYDTSPENKLFVYEKESKFTTRSGRSVLKYKSIEEIDDEEIKRHQEKYVVHLSYYDFPKLVDFSPKDGSKLVLSVSEPFDEESELEESKIINWCKSLGMPYEYIHSSGHMSGSDLKWMVKEINPKIILPIHSTFENAQLIKEMFPDRVKILEKGQKFEVAKRRTTLTDYM